MRKPASCRKTKRVPTDVQRGFGFTGELSGVARASAPGEIKASPLAAFDEGSRYELWVGDRPLEKYLAERGLQHILELQKLISSLDLVPLKLAYKFGGRRPFHPGSMLGLIIYGMLIRRWSLRELEVIAQTDVCAWWITGGIQPDHSTIGKFVVLHAEVLTKIFAQDVFARIVAALGLKPDDAAFDGTIIQSAASHLGALKQEAAEVAAAKAADEAKREPDSPQAQAKAEQTAQVVQVLGERAANREAQGKPGENVLVAPSDVDAVVQPLKTGPIRPAYKPSIVATRERLIAAQIVHPSCENAVVEDLIRQYFDAFNAYPSTGLLDAGYHCNKILKTLSDLGINVLCPEGKAKGDDDFLKTRGTQFAKSAFVYEEDTDSYRCPAGKHLQGLTHTERDVAGRTYRRYLGSDCAQCPMRAKCTESSKGRSVKRYADDEYKEAMKQVFAQQAARDDYRGRQAMVEPVFSELKGCQNLNRFHRRGLKRVGAEFALHCIAYNLKRAVALAAAKSAAAVAAAAAAEAAAAAAVLWLLALTLAAARAGRRAGGWDESRPRPTPGRASAPQASFAPSLFAA